MTECIYLSEARYIEGFKIFLKFNTGESGEVDLEDFYILGSYAPDELYRLKMAISLDDYLPAFKQMTGTSLEEQETMVLKSNILQIDLQDRNIDRAKLSIMDMTGRLCYEQKLVDKRTSVNTQERIGRG